LAGPSIFCLRKLISYPGGESPVQARSAEPDCTDPAERSLPKSETAKVMGRLNTRDVVVFAERHRISLDWLICGDLKGLLRTVRWRQTIPR
jgi:hypothetical protein